MGKKKSQEFYSAIDQIADMENIWEGLLLEVNRFI